MSLIVRLYFLNGIIKLPFLELPIIIDENLKLVSQQYTEPGQTGMMCRLAVALYWWQRLITFGSSRIRVKHSLVSNVKLMWLLWLKLWLLSDFILTKLRQGMFQFTMVMKHYQVSLVKV